MGLLNKFRKEGKKKEYEQEVIQNLISLFNTKQSFGAWQKGLGLKSYCLGKSRNHIIEEMIADIKFNIEQFEKRIKVIEIQAINDTSIVNLSFQIKCQLGEQFHSFYIGFSSHGPVQLEVAN